MGGIPGVRVVEYTHVAVSSIAADEHCGNGTKLIHYVKTGEIYSRTIRYKDTHSPQGQLLVLYTDPSRLSGQDAAMAQSSTSVLGFSAPSFTHASDLVLPATINAQLRELLLAGQAAVAGEEDDNSRVVSILQRYPNAYVPQVNVK